MPSSQSLLVALLLCLQYACSLAFVVDKRSIGSGRRHLEDALEFIQEKQRNIREASPNDPYGYQAEYYWPLDSKIGEQLDSESALLDELLTKDNQLNPDILEPSEPQDRENDEVSEKELENILGDDDNDVDTEAAPENDKRIPYDLRSGEPDTSDTLPVLSDDDVQKLIGTAEAQEQDFLQDDITNNTDEDGGYDENNGIPNTEESTVEPASEEEVQNILEDNTDDENDAGDNTFDSRLNKEYILGPYVDDASNTVSNVKRKRSYVPHEDRKRKLDVRSIPSSENLNREFIKKFIQLEDDENTQLANALNMATFSQVMGSEKYIPEEMRYLKKAIEDEEALQTLKSSFALGNGEEVEEEEEEELEPDAVKRGDPALDEVLEPEDEENEVQDEVNGVLADKFRQYLLRTSVLSRPEEEAEDVEAEEEVEAPAADQGGHWYDGPVDLSQEGISDEELELNPFLRDLWEKYKAGKMEKRQEDFADEQEVETTSDIGSMLENYIDHLSPESKDKLKEEVQQALSELAPAEQGTTSCPAVEELTDNCSFLKRYDLDLDDEATGLCNRHRLCYSCGSINGVTADECDVGYLGEAERLCKDDPECKKDVADLYVLMLTDHSFIAPEDASRVCTDSCAMNFVYGVSTK